MRAPSRTPAPTPSGQGVRVARVAQQFSQGTIDFTSNNLDLAISGQGFFVLEAPDGTQAYTRSGAYSVDRDGYVINHAADKLQIYEAVNGVGGATTFNTGVLTDLQLPTTPSAPNASGNHQCGTQSQRIRKCRRRWHSIRQTRPVTTARRRPRSTIRWAMRIPRPCTSARPRTNAWDQYLYVDGNNIPPTGNAVPPAAPIPFTLDFDSTGALTQVNGAAATSDLTAAFDPGTGAANLTLTMDFSGTTQYGSSFAVNNLSPGRLHLRASGRCRHRHRGRGVRPLHQRTVFGAGQGGPGQVQQPAGSAPGRRYQLGRELLVRYATAGRGRHLELRSDPVRRTGGIERRYCRSSWST